MGHKLLKSLKKNGRDPSKWRVFENGGWAVEAVPAFGDQTAVSRVSQLRASHSEQAKATSAAGILPGHGRSGTSFPGAVHDVPIHTHTSPWRRCFMCCVAAGRTTCPACSRSRRVRTAGVRARTASTAAVRAWLTNERALFTDDLSCAPRRRSSLTTQGDGSSKHLLRALSEQCFRYKSLCFPLALS